MMHTGLTLVSIVDGSQSLHGGAHWFVLEYCTGVFNGLFTVMALGVLWMIQGCWLGMYGCTGVHNELFITLGLRCIIVYFKAVVLVCINVLVCIMDGL